jgi:DNA primase
VQGVGAPKATGFSVKELTDVGLVSQPRGGGAPQDRFRGRLMFPVCDMQGRVVGFGARKLGSARAPKYVNSPAAEIYSKSELLYGAHHARAGAAKAGVVIVVEGYIDAVAMHQAGIVNTVALMGTAVSEPQIVALRRVATTVVLMVDATSPALMRSCVIAREAGLEVLVASLPAGVDPGALVQHNGAAAAGELFAAAVAFARFHVLHHVERADLSTAEGKDHLVSELRDVFADIPSSAVREDLIALVGERLALAPALVSSWMPTPEAPSRQATSLPAE